MKYTHTLPLIIWILLAGAIALGALQREWITVFIGIVTLILTIAPYKLAKRLNFHIPDGFLSAIVLFIYSTLLLGEVGDFYERFWWWDVILHIGSAISFGIIGFVVLLLLLRNERIKASPYTIAMFAFSFAVAIGVLWEIFEFSMDQLFGMNMQKSGLIDTMWDLILDTFGALVAAIAGYVYLRKNKKSVVSGVIEEMVEKNQEK
jgi:uncharacterized membrane protein